MCLRENGIEQKVGYFCDSSRGYSSLTIHKDISSEDNPLLVVDLRFYLGERIRANWRYLMRTLLRGGLISEFKLGIRAFESLSRTFLPQITL